MSIGIAFFRKVDDGENDFEQWQMGEMLIAESEYPQGTELDFQVTDAPDSEYVQRARFVIESDFYPGIQIRLTIFDENENQLAQNTLETWYQSWNTGVFWADIYYAKFEVLSIGSGEECFFRIESHS